MTSAEAMEMARQLFGQWGDSLGADSRIRGLLETLRAKVAASGRVALEVGVAAACQRCEEEEGGSCCGAGIEDRYSPQLLLINLLLGRTFPAACQRCEEEEGGSCCGAGIEDRYSPQLLLINLLLGRTFPAARRFADSCYFLGADGCMLLARDILCINYLCPGLQKSLAHEDLVRLQTTTGEEMESVFRLYDAVKQFLREQGRNHRTTELEHGTDCQI